jgi:hypothetical protein
MADLRWMRYDLGNITAGFKAGLMGLLPRLADLSPVFNTARSIHSFN